jgi:hypothetical protein
VVGSTANTSSRETVPRIKGKLLLTGVAALLLATGIAHASEYHAIQCGKKRIYVLGHHGYSFYEIKEDKRNDQALPDRWFSQTANGDWYFRGKLCHRIPCDKITLKPCDN